MDSSENNEAATLLLPHGHDQGQAPTVWSMLFEIRNDVKEIRVGQTHLAERVLALEMQNRFEQNLEEHRRSFRYVLWGLMGTIVVGLVSAGSNIISHWH